VAVTLRAVLLAGGAGTRLWPLSTESRPKQFLRIRGTTSLLQDAYRRVQPIASRVLVATAARYADATRRDLPGLSPADLLLEPSRRNTGAAVVGAALFLADSGDEPVAVLPADQTVADEDEFRRCLEAAAGAASADTSRSIPAPERVAFGVSSKSRTGQPPRSTCGRADSSGTRGSSCSARPR
jgi:mannose-1-phosphate guanylyltransferase